MEMSQADLRSGPKNHKCCADLCASLAVRISGTLFHVTGGLEGCCKVEWADIATTQLPPQQGGANKTLSESPEYGMETALALLSNP